MTLRLILLRNLLKIFRTPDVDPFKVSEPDLKAFGQPLEPEDPQAPPPSTPSGGTTPVAPSPVTVSAQEPVTKIESSLSEMSLKSGMTDLRNDIHHLGLHDMKITNFQSVISRDTNINMYHMIKWLNVTENLLIYFDHRNQ